MTGSTFGPERHGHADRSPRRHISNYMPLASGFGAGPTGKCIDEVEVTGGEATAAVMGWPVVTPARATNPVTATAATIVESVFMVNLHH